MKRLVEIYNSYGNHMGEELRKRFVIEDSADEREEMVRAYSGEPCSSDLAFVSGIEDIFFFTKPGGDWDDPTGGNIVITTKEEAYKKLVANFVREIHELDELFKLKEPE